MNISQEMVSIALALEDAGARHVLVVGGGVRDFLAGVPCKDVDVEVYGIDIHTLITVLARFGKVDQVGVSFGVIKLTTNEDDYDFTLPRRENKAGQGHRGFIVEFDAGISVAEAAARRDYTINAMGYDVLRGQLIDPWFGARDLHEGVLRATSEHFGEDPLRVLRGMQFAARYNLAMDPDTIGMCQDIAHEYCTLALERIWGEWQKWAGKGVVPSRGLQVLRETGWLQFYPELVSLIGVPQDPEWHPEGDVWHHTCHTVDAAARIATRDNLDRESRVVLVLAALLHDVGKVATTVMRGRWQSPGHADAGENIARTFLSRIGCPGNIAKRVAIMVREHMCHVSWGNVTERTVRRLAVRLSPVTIAEVARVVEADHSGRPPLSAGMPPAMALALEMGKELAISDCQPEPILMGRHLIDLGWQPGPHFAPVLDRAYSAQIEGAFCSLNGALAWLSEQA